MLLQGLHCLIILRLIAKGLLSSLSIHANVFTQRQQHILVPKLSKELEKKRNKS